VTLASATAAEYGVNEYNTGEYNANLTRNTVHVNASGSGKVVQVGIDATPSSYVISLQSLDILTKEGRI
jgi:hypothetical protein